MKDPKRLLEGDGTAFERALLGAIARERPSRDLHRKMSLGIGLVGVGVVAKAASASWNQIAMAGVVVVGLVTGGAVVVKREHDRPMPVVQAMGLPTPASFEVAHPAALLEPVPESVPSNSPAEPEPVQREPAVRRGATAPVADIRDEIRLLDQARSAVRSGRSSQALRALAKYEQRYPRGQFRQEVQVLRMEALAQTGERERASALAKRFLAEHPESPHVERVEDVRK
ncbi:MAG TPA: outer membrane protein assembly factor BamD [Polyangiaceae bacterium]